VDRAGLGPKWVRILFLKADVTCWEEFCDGEKGELSHAITDAEEQAGEACQRLRLDLWKVRGK
jgi:hypothetical protein